MLAYELRDKRKAETRAVRLGGYKGIEQDRQYVLRHTRTVVAYAKFERQRDAILTARNRYPDARPEGGRQGDLALRISTDRFRRILHQIEEDLNQLIAVGVDGRKRRVIVLQNLDAAGKSVLGNGLHVIEHDVD